MPILPSLGRLYRQAESRQEPLASIEEAFFKFTAVESRIQYDPSALFSFPTSLGFVCQPYWRFAHVPVLV